MTDKDQEETEARLLAYLDGALPEDDRVRLEQDLKDNPVLAAQLAAMDLDTDMLRKGMDEVLAQAPLVPEIDPKGRGLPYYAAAACIALVMLFGGFALVRPGAQEDWRDYAAAYHRLYRPETLAAPVTGDGGVAVVSAALNRDLSALANVAGLEFKRAQVLGWKDSPLVQFAYLDGKTRPFAICVTEAAAGTAQRGVETSTRHGLPTASFSTGTLDVMVIGGLGAGDVGALAQELTRIF